jgi:hypothetical protein
VVEESSLSSSPSLLSLSLSLSRPVEIATLDGISGWRVVSMEGHPWAFQFCLVVGGSVVGWSSCWWMGW